MPTVIDSLAVELGLDPKKFKKGLQEAAKDTKETENVVVKAADHMVGALHRVATEFLGLFLVVRSVSDVVDFFANLNESTRQLGINSRNFGVAANELRSLGNVAELAGGQADDALKTVQGLTQAEFNRERGFGGNDERLQTLAYLGVPFQGEHGGLRDIKGILLDLNRVLQRLPQPERLQFAQKAGIQGGLGLAVAEDPSKFRAYLAEQERQIALRKQDTDAAERLARAWLLLRQEMERIATRILTDISPALEKLFRRIGDFVTTHQGDITKGFDKVLEWFNGPGPGHVIDALVQIGDAAMNVAKAINDIAEFWFGKTDKPGEAAIEPGVKQGSLRSRIEAAMAVRGDISKIDEVQLRELSGRHRVPVNVLTQVPGGISGEEAARALEILHGRVGGDKGDPDWSKTLAEFKRRTVFTAPNPNALNSARGAVPTPNVPRRPAANDSKPTAMNSGTSVQIDNMTINTRATDANGIAADMNSALRRKLMVAQADVGMVA
jgi:hypothetical protein